MSVTSNIPADVWAVVGGNPVPGEPDGIAAKAKVYSSIADNADRCRNELRRLLSTQTTWKGDAADAYRKELDGNASLPHDLLKLNDSYTVAGDALQRYADTLRDLQDEAAREAGVGRQASEDEATRTKQVQARESQVQHARDAVGSHNDYLNQLRQAMSDPAYSDRTNPANAEFARQVDERYLNGRNEANQLNSDLQAASQSLDADRRSLDDARTRLKKAKENIQRIRQERDTIVQDTVDCIEQASDLGIKNKSWWQKAIDYVKDHWVNALDSLSKALDKLGLVIGIIGLIVAIIAAPFSGGASLLFYLAVAGAVVSGLKLACDIVLVTQGRRSWKDVGMGAIDFALSVVGAKSAMAAAKAAKAASTASTLMNAGKNVADDVGKSGIKALVKSGAKKILNHPIVKKIETAKRHVDELLDFPGKHLARDLMRTSGGQKAAHFVDGIMHNIISAKPQKLYLQRWVEKSFTNTPRILHKLASLQDDPVVTVDSRYAQCRVAPVPGGQGAR